MYERCSTLKNTPTWTSAGIGPVDSLVKPLSLDAVRDWWLKKRSDISDDDAMAFLFGEIESLQADREWQIKQNVHMFEALEKMAAILPMGHTIRERECFELVQAAMVEAV